MNIKSTFLVAATACVYLVGCSQPDDKKTTGSANQNAPVTAPAATQGTNNAVALNPAHGAPGHRCDIEVGAPLNSQAQPNLQTPPPRPLAQPQTVAGTNPPHGEPGHDCAKPVGAPLN